MFKYSERDGGKEGCRTQGRTREDEREKERERERERDFIRTMIVARTERSQIGCHRANRVS